MTIIDQWQKELDGVARPEKIAALSGFFKTGPGEYGEGDQFIGVTVPDNRSVARRYAEQPIEVFNTMLLSPVHEHRLSALLAMVHSYERTKDPERRRAIIDAYIANVERCNNWDLVDLSAPQIIGREIADGRLADVHARLSASPLLWARRVAVVATLHPVMKHRRIEEALTQCEIHTSDPEPLMHKAVGWVLREVGKKDTGAMLQFLESNIHRMSATTLSYATEKLPKEERKAWQQRRKHFAGK